MRWLALFLVLFTPLFAQCEEEEDQLYLSLNISEGQRLVLSNGSTYEIAPIDQIYAAYWITPFPIMLSESGDPDYPVKITNIHTGTFVRGRQLITGEVIEEERQKREAIEKGQRARPPSIQQTPEVEPKQPDQNPNKIES